VLSVLHGASYLLARNNSKSIGRRWGASIWSGDARRVDVDVPLFEEHLGSGFARSHLELDQNPLSADNRNAPLIRHAVVMAVGGPTSAIIAVVLAKRALDILRELY
jgi:hypothetical protein